MKSVVKSILLTLIITTSFTSIFNLHVLALAYQNSEGCYADYNGNGQIDPQDFQIFAQNYKITLNDCSKDVTEYDCKLDGRDFGEFAKVYKTTQCKATTETRGLVLNIDPAFDRQKLPVSMQIWHTRLINSFTNTAIYPNPYTAAASRDVYSLGRTVNNHITALLAALRATGDPAILAEIDKIMEIARAGLADVQPECAVYNFCGSQQDGFLNWVWLASAGESRHYGNDIHTMDEMLTHSVIAAGAYALYTNRNYAQTYADHSNFWKDYLQNHFEAKVRARSNILTNPIFINEDLTHPYIQFSRFDYYMYKMTGKQKYLDAYKKRELLATSKIFVKREVAGKDTFVWDHRQPWAFNSSDVIVNMGKPLIGCQSTSYAVYTFGAVLDLGMDNAPLYRNPKNRSTFSNTMTKSIIPDNAISTTIMAPDVCGGVTVAGEGIPLYFDDNDPFSRSSIWTHPGQAIWDDSDKLKTLYANLYDSVEPNKMNPNAVFIPAYMLAVERVRL